MDFVVGHPRSGTQFLAELLNAGREPKIAGHEILVDLPGGFQIVSKATEFFEGRCDERRVDQLLTATDKPDSGSIVTGSSPGS